MESELTNIVNGHKVNATLYRGGDVLLPRGVDTLVELNVSEVICLKNSAQDSYEEIDAERRAVEAAGLTFVHAPMNSRGMFSYDDISKVPSILARIDTAEGVVFVHCHHGSDRTGVVIACYKIYKGEYLARALSEMKLYGNAWYNFGMRAAVKEFARSQLQRNRIVSFPKPPV